MWPWQTPDELTLISNSILRRSNTCWKTGRVLTSSSTKRQTEWPWQSTAPCTAGDHFCLPCCWGLEDSHKESKRKNIMNTSSWSLMEKTRYSSDEIINIPQWNLHKLRPLDELFMPACADDPRRMACTALQECSTAFVYPRTPNWAYLQHLWDQITTGVPGQ